MDYHKHIINIGVNAREALIRLESLPDAETKTLFIVDANNKLLGSITDGDIRRGLLKDKEISDPVEVFMNTSFRYLKSSDVEVTTLSRFRKEEIYLIPLLNERLEIDNIIDLKYTNSIIPATALIMAGGKGSRLSPLTDNVPKPLLKIGTKPIIEHNIDRLIKFGITDFYISVKYLSAQIKQYLGNGDSKGIKITYLEESEPLGTLGSITLIDKIESEHLLVMNSDILSNIDFEDFFQFYRENDAEMCIASIPYQVKVPYGVLELNRDTIISFKEKPTYTYYSNGGIYFMKRAVKDKVPEKTFYDATDLMVALIVAKKKITHYPILGYWIDIGKHEDYLKVQEDIKHIKF
jgi:dTDP-glucose pyrophosphorylase